MVAVHLIFRSPVLENRFFSTFNLIKRKFTIWESLSHISLLLNMFLQWNLHNSRVNILFLFLPKTQGGCIKLQLGGCDIVGHQESRRSHLAVDVPVQGGRGEGVEGGAVGRQGVSWIVGWQGAWDDWTLLWQIYKISMKSSRSSKRLNFLFP